MRSESHPWVLARPTILRVAAIILTLAIFIADTVTDLEIAVAVFYVAVVLMSLSFSQPLPPTSRNSWRADGCRSPLAA